MVLAGVSDRLFSLRSWLFPFRVLLELDDHSLTILALQEGRSVPTVKWLERIPLPIGTCDQAIPVRTDVLADFIGDLLVERGFAGARVAAVLPEHASEWHLVQWPGGVFPGDPRSLLMQRARESGFRLALQSADLHEVRLGSHSQLGPPTSLVIAVRRSLLQSWIETFASAGLTLDGIEAGQVCLVRALQPLLQETPDSQLIAVLELSQDGGHLLLLQGGMPVYQRKLSSSLVGMVGLADELSRSVDFWRQQERTVTSVRLLLHGPWAALREDVVEPLQQLLPAWDVKVVDPFAQGWLAAPAESLNIAEEANPLGVELLRMLGLALVEAHR